jgi:hypothetical protein
LKGKVPEIDRESVLNAAADYLALPYRAPRLERTLVDILVATEMFAYGEEMFRPIPAALRWFPVRSRYSNGTLYSAISSVCSEQPSYCWAAP